jgi:hypothetical protein
MMSAKSLFNMAEHQITQMVLRPGNYLTKIQSIKHELKDTGKQFVLEFANDDGRFTQSFWYQHDTSEIAQKIGRDKLKRIGIIQKAPSLDLTEDPRSWEPLQEYGIAIAVRRQVRAGEVQKYFDQKNDVWRERFEITHFKSALHELPEFDQDFDEDDASTEEIPKEGDDVPF